MPDILSPTLTNSERQRVADLLWQTIANVEKGSQSNYWTGQQLRHIAAIIEPPYGERHDSSEASGTALHS